ncbi:MAG: DUF4349 domain-containing protein, partial [Parvularculaceae bacterium]|nr:DUF4349 domain-containing protein [Parvularculaceae bacterium]
MLAYSYGMSARAPHGKVRPLLEAHAKACFDAGPAACQLIQSQIDAEDDQSVSGSLQLRAEPKWLAGFRQRIPADVKAAGGRITAENVSTEDLTESIRDWDAQLKAKTALRDRIKAMLERREGSLADALQAEQALAEVQAQIDELNAALAQARTRIRMSSLTVSYESEATAP